MSHEFSFFIIYIFFRGFKNWNGQLEEARVYVVKQHLNWLEPAFIELAFEIFALLLVW